MTRAKWRAGAPLAGAMAMGLTAMSSAPAIAESTTTTSMPVIATVVSTCVVVATPLSFGNYNTSTPTDTDAEANITVNCTPGAVYNVGLDAGQNSSDVTARKMKVGSGTATMDYFIFQDATRTLNWGNTKGTDTVTGVGTDQDQVLSVYGRVPAGIPVEVGGYTDVVTVTVTF